MYFARAVKYTLSVWFSSQCMCFEAVLILCEITFEYSKIRRNNCWIRGAWAEISHLRWHNTCKLPTALLLKLSALQWTWMEAQECLLPYAGFLNVLFYKHFVGVLQRQPADWKLAVFRATNVEVSRWWRNANCWMIFTQVVMTCRGLSFLWLKVGKSHKD